MTKTTGDGQQESATPPRDDLAKSGRTRTWWWIAGLVAIVGAIAIVLALLGTGSGAQTSETAAVRNFAAVTQTDLIEMDSFDGTLGTEDGDPVGSPTDGTVTSTADVGTMIEQGDVFLTVNNEPVVLLYGELPSYRNLTATEDTLTVTGNAAGVVTDVIAEGETLTQGSVLYRVNGEPVVVMYGDVPAYRTLRDLTENLTGADVLQLEEALVALGYDPELLASVDDEFTDYTETMVERWQADLGVEEDGEVVFGDVVFIPGQAEVISVAVAVGDSVNAGQPIVTVTSGDALSGPDLLQLEEALEELGYEGLVVDGVWDDATKAAVLAWQIDTGLEADGSVDLGEVVFLAAPVRVNEVLASVGSSVAPGTPVLGISSADQSVLFELPAADQGLLVVGQEVNIEMPDGSDTPGTVTEIASVARGVQAEATFEVRIVLSDPSVAVGLDEAPVDVEVVSDSVSNVLAIPVSALVALQEGGYAVEVDAGGGTRLVAVEPGFYADGLVEVESGELAVGDMVVVP